MKITKTTRIFININYLLLFIVGIISLIPFMHIIAKSLSNEGAVISGKVLFWPIGLNIDAYRYAFLNTPILRAFKNTFFVTFTGSLLALLVCSMAAFPLSLTKLKGRKILIYYFVFTMLFNGGLIPSFLLMKDIGLLNNLWSLILPHIVNVFNLIILKNYFEGISESLQEAARIDGASNVRILFQIILPIAKPILATLAIFFAVQFWNSYFNAMLYMTDPKKVTLQLFLVNIVKQAANPLNIGEEAMNVPADSVRASTAMIGTLPILMVYPFMQKHFVKGIVMGSVKG